MSRKDPTNNDGDFHLGFAEGALVNACPFCGEHNLTMNNTHTPKYWIECDDCEAERMAHTAPDLVKGRYGSLKQHAASRDDALRRWNERPEPAGLDYRLVKKPTASLVKEEKQ